jgi:hypothetical protein
MDEFAKINSFPEREKSKSARNGFLNAHHRTSLCVMAGHATKKLADQLSLRHE